MRNLSCIPFAILCLLSAASCIEEKLDACPPGGGSVTVALRVEKFRTRPPYRPSDMEPDFAARVHSLDYLIYADGRLVGQGRAEDIRAADGDSYLFRCDTLPFGTYRLAFAANTEPRMMTGKKDAPELCYIAYQGEGGDDHFRADVPFEVTCPCRNEFEAVLQRVHGVTRFRFENVPAEIASVEVSLDNVGGRMPLCGDPDLPCEVVRRIPVAGLAARAAGSYTLGTFCTLPGVKTAWRLKLYADDASSPVYDRLVTDTLCIECNQLTELAARFRDGDFQGEIDFSVDVDTTWDGSNDGGGDVTLSRRTAAASRTQDTASR